MSEHEDKLILLGLIEQLASEYLDNNPMERMDVDMGRPIEEHDDPLGLMCAAYSMLFWESDLFMKEKVH